MGIKMGTLEWFTSSLQKEEQNWDIEKFYKE